MKATTLWTLPLLLGGLVSTATALDLGEKIDVEFEDFTATQASSLVDLRGRAVLIEYFAYW